MVHFAKFHQTNQDSRDHAFRLSFNHCTPAPQLEQSSTWFTNNLWRLRTSIWMKRFELWSCLNRKIQWMIHRVSRPKTEKWLEFSQKFSECMAACFCIWSINFVKTDNTFSSITSMENSWKVQTLAKHLSKYLMRSSNLVPGFHVIS